MIWNGDCKVDGCEREAVDKSGYCKKHKNIMSTQTDTASLPNWSDCEAASDAGTATALQKFIYDNEPGDSEDARQWRHDLKSAIEEAIKPYKDGWLDQAARDSAEIVRLETIIESLEATNVGCPSKWPKGYRPQWRDGAYHWTSDYESRAAHSLPASEQRAVAGAASEAYWKEDGGLNNARVLTLRSKPYSAGAADRSVGKCECGHDYKLHRAISECMGHGCECHEFPPAATADETEDMSAGKAKSAEEWLLSGGGGMEDAEHATVTFHGMCELLDAYLEDMTATPEQVCAARNATLPPRDCGEDTAMLDWWLRNSDLNFHERTALRDAMKSQTGKRGCPKCGSLIEGVHYGEAH